MQLVGLADDGQACTLPKGKQILGQVLMAGGAVGAAYIAHTKSEKSLPLTLGAFVAGGLVAGLIAVNTISKPVCTQ